MATFTTYEEFVGPLHIPNTEEDEHLQEFIDRCEDELLSKVLGYKMHKDLLTAFETDPQPVGVLKEFWTGKEYTDKYDRANFWPGFLTAEYNLLSRYIYCKWMEDSQTYTSSDGEKKTESANARNANADRKFVNAWNQMVEYLLIMDDFLVQNADDYPDYIGRTQWPDLTYGNKSFFEKDNLLGI